VEEDDDGHRRLRRPTRGTPQGGVISPLLANIYLHWLDHRFHRSDGPAVWANAKLVRYADDFVILARYVGNRLRRWSDEILEDWMGLRINRDKTRVVDLTVPKAHFDFLGFRFRYFRSWRARKGRYLHVEPSPKSEARLRERLRDLIHPRWNWLPTREVIARLNQTLRGWWGYFRVGHPSRVFRRIDWQVEYRLYQHLNRRSQRHASIPSGRSFYEHLNSLGLVRLVAGGRHLSVHARGEVFGSAGCGKSARPVR
jgi:RNA-directed DNA polymerase